MSGTISQYDNMQRIFSTTKVASITRQMRIPQDLADWGITRNSPIGPLPSQTQQRNGRNYLGGI
jgi:hypothetical protein